MANAHGVDALRKLNAAVRRHYIPVHDPRPLEGSKDGIVFVTVTGSEAIPLWRRFRAIVDETGWWPVLLGDDEELEYHLENLEEFEDEEDESQVQAIIQSAGQIDAARWLEQQTRDLDSQMGEWPSNLVSEPSGDASFTIPRDVLTGEPSPAVHLGLVPTRQGWEVPAYLRFGGFNSCPQPEEHVALWRRWHELYGAELLGVSHDVIEGWIMRPPTDREGAMRLAREQYVYCDDIVSQGCGTISALGAVLLNHTTWYFWWD